MDENNLKNSSFTKKSKGGKFLTIFLIVLLVISSSTTVFYYYKYQTIKNNPASVTETTTQELVNTVNKLIKLPTDEQPTVATVEDKDKLTDQPFFSSTENGDKILIYTEAKQAIIYRPSSNRIINVGPIVINSDIENVE